MRCLQRRAGIDPTPRRRFKVRTLNQRARYWSESAPVLPGDGMWRVAKQCIDRLDRPAGDHREGLIQLTLDGSERIRQARRHHDRVRCRRQVQQRAIQIKQQRRCPERRQRISRHGVHPAAVCLKWAVQRGQVPIPMSTNRKNYVANIHAVAGDPLTAEEMDRIAGIDRNCRLVKGQVFLWKEGQTWEDLWDLNGEIKP